MTDARDEVSRSQIRRRMLTIARLDGPHREHQWVPAGNFLRAADDAGSAIADEAEAKSLLEDLRDWGLLEEAGPGDLGGAASAFRHRRFRLTKKGRALWMQEIEPIPGISDDRFGD